MVQIPIYLFCLFRYSVPLFFLCVRTNVNVIGVFITQSEMKEDIKEALEVFKKWNAHWNLSHFMVDFCEAEIGPLEEVFMGKSFDFLIPFFKKDGLLLMVYPHHPVYYKPFDTCDTFS